MRLIFTFEATLISRIVAFGAPRCWTEHFSNFIENLGVHQSTGNPCLYVYIKGTKRILLSIYVDNGLIAATNERLIDELLYNLSKQFTMTSTKNVQNFLGIEICSLKDGSIFIHKNKYTRSMLDKFNISEANSVSTPIKYNYDNFIRERKTVKYHIVKR